ncbi:4-hydroxy-3-methylbut-2-en-1-yl diphosphate synthase (flavodoxin) [Gemmata obscuriglobus]|uniref:4-hydroxy-3-methylbut-2-en-1-yl diphosphate synthase (flavodoxin) n=1 Tax=Gemmata obscuriglobus TaxID=114 RepID=A0A2Z3H0P4_9BACT|nr:flavodoxin-dependent (E)-4-hydroxy-3-methylbut-2-enyl-diphosphate synthase [Gemmata obscuriglobus]AWM39298.1 flavodoxin-dependent (E)-4-hydroxy-3-methylbut-2-enyl-diphosphate synthase [Gemmata obscuriglobus]QEG27640.1 4-hydroxy-3-methylbut-2-en-1-yl diphosphate synthase (flavodoxin) [Gemmata obscuriglobus]VTS04803.1 4-hydroxy-3-methylbut-2-en-1-yl diphosphate synthase : 4-hydroxy-3-methylbut-2-en-1-yl diphosphate synthase OS=Singulisphaera acidiphila (strain ATCC BAA-1392 / DSM 18658 / VKM B-
MATSSRFDISRLEAAPRVPGKPRHKTREVKVGTRVFGGSNPVWVQSMTTTDTFDVDATVKQIHALEEAGCELVRVTVPKPEDAGALSAIRARVGIPLICDIHFDYKMALAALDHPVDKIRINPGNINKAGDTTHDRFRQIVRKAKQKGIPMRIGVNAGSLETEVNLKYGFPCPPAMVESALRYIEVAESEGYHDIIVSLKSSDVLVAVEAYRLFAQMCDYPTHIGITEAGKPPYAVTKSAAGLAPILLDGIGDTIRISLLGDPVPEIAAAFDILQATQRRVRRPELIACPTCGRLAIDLEDIIAKLEARLNGKRLPVKISVLGCIVNGPGEAREADIGIAAGNGQGMIFRNGEMVRRVPEAEIVDALMEELARWESENQHRIPKTTDAEGLGRRKLPVVAS